MNSQPVSAPAHRKNRWLGLAVLGVCFSFGKSATANDWDPESDADNYASLWLRADIDRVGGQFWLGGTTTLGALDLASALIVSQAYPGVIDPVQNAAFNDAVDDNYRAPSLRLELGPAFARGGFFLLPKVGLGYDFERGKVAPLVPQLMSIIQGGPLYIESWLQVFLYDVFEEGSQDSFYTRDMILVALDNHWALGVQTELSIAVQNSHGNALRSWPVGARVNFAADELLTCGLFIGYETQPAARNTRHDVLAGRFTTTLLW